MLKTALKPRWILSLILAMVIAAVFVLLSQWQFSSSSTSTAPPPTTTEQVRPLGGVFSPGVSMTPAVADQLVTMDGEFVPDTRVLVQDRLQGERPGFWLVSAFAVDGGDGTGADGSSDDGGAGTVIPVVRGWVPDAAAADAVPAPEGSATVVGRLLPSEGPVAERPVDGQIPTLSVAELINRWDRPAYAGFVVSFDTVVNGTAVPPRAPLEAVEVGPQPQETPVNWLNIFYAIEWFVFAGFAFFLWWRLVADDHRRTLEEAEDLEAADRDAPGCETDDSADSRDSGDTADDDRGGPDTQPALPSQTTSEVKQ